MAKIDAFVIAVGTDDDIVYSKSTAVQVRIYTFFLFLCSGRITECERLISGMYKTRGPLKLEPHLNTSTNKFIAKLLTTGKLKDKFTNV